MSRYRAVLALAVGAVALVVSLSGCAAFVQDAGVRATVLPEGPAATPSASALSTPAPASTPGTRDCGGSDAVFEGSGIVVTAVGICPNVIVRGSGVEVDLTGAQVSTLSVFGDRVTVTAAGVATTAIAGQNNSVALDSGEAVTLTGDTNTVDVAGALTTVTVAGNANTVLAGSIGAVQQAGSGNTVRPRG